MRTRVPVLVAAVVTVILIAAPASAQTGAFAGAGASVSGIWFAHTESRSPAVYSSDTSGTTSDWFVNAGGTVARHAVLQAELSFGRDLRTDIAAPIYPTPPVGTQTETVTYRFRSAAFLAGYTTGTSRRVNVCALAGAMFIQTRRTIYEAYTPPAPSPYPIYSTDSTEIIYSVAPMFGLDVPIEAGSRVLIVPQVRTYKIPGGGPIAVSGGAGARVKF